jgi:hypothetical protein
MISYEGGLGGDGAAMLQHFPQQFPAFMLQKSIDFPDRSEAA